MLYLQSNRLQIEIALPGEAPNDNSRFDRSGTITEIILDKVHRFCASEPRNLSHPWTGGRGLTNAYKLDLSPETPVGELFPRLGVGLLTKPDDRPYNFFQKYHVAPYPASWNQTEDSVSFITEPIPCQGYAARQLKTVRLTGNTITMTVNLTNTGEKTINTHEFCHNFLTVDSMALGPGYHLDIPQLSEKVNHDLPDTLAWSGSGFSFTRYDDKPVFYPIDLKHIACSNRFVWKLSNTGAGAYVEGTDHFSPSHIYLWYVDHMVCMETYHDIHIKPGESHEWMRSWTFDEL